jgi:hypothetical protein
MVNPRQTIRVFCFALLLALFSAASATVAQAQFTITPQGFSPAAVDPGGSATALLDVQPNGSSSPVSFEVTPCTVTSTQTTGTMPVCTVSPGTVTPPATPAVTVTTTGGSVSPTGAGTYTITITGVSGSFTQSVTMPLGVEPVTQTYALSVSPTTATPSPILQGATATTVVTITPIAGYTGTVTPACLSVTPAVTPAPYCSFNPTSVPITSSGEPPTTTMTINTVGPTPVVKLWKRPIFYALWLFPGFMLMGTCLTGALPKSARRSAMSALLLMALASVIFLPACGTTTNTTPSGDTPVGTYTFTLTAADGNGLGPSTATTTTVTLTVN